MIHWRSTSLRLALITLLSLAALAACVPGRSTELSNVDTTPTVVVIQPKPGQIVPANQQVLVTSQSDDPDGIQRVELWADGVLARTDVNPTTESPYVVAQAWQSERPGSHVFIVKAYDVRGNEGQSDPVVVTVTEAPPIYPGRTGVPYDPRDRHATTVTHSDTGSVTHLDPSALPDLDAGHSNRHAHAGVHPGVSGGEVYHCPGACPGGCGTECATPTPTATRPTFRPTDFALHDLLKPIWDKPEVSQLIGYPTAAASDDRQYARQYFERGYMFWWNRPDARGLIWVVQMPDGGAMSGFGWIGPFEDTWDGHDPISCEAASQTAYGPRSGFGRLWCDHPEIAQTIGAAREPERGTGESTDYGVVQTFQGGTILYSPLDREVWVLANGGAWLRYFR